MGDYDLITEARGDLIIVTEIATGFYAVYMKRPGEIHLTLKDRAGTDDTRFLPRRFRLR